MIIVTNYAITHDGDFYYVCNLDKPICPKCKSTLKVRDSKNRNVKSADGSIYMFKLRRLQCENCGKLHTELPDFIQEYKRYSKITIEGYLNGKITEISADNKTLYRWRKATHP